MRILFLPPVRLCQRFDGCVPVWLIFRLSLLMLAVWVILAPTTFAQQALPSTKDSLKSVRLPQVEVIGSPDRLSNLPGSAKQISNDELQRRVPLSGNEILRSVTGIHVVDEEGLGLRANIGIRGLDPDRSRTVLILEDGVPVALAPYGEPELYYTPSMDRMSGLEILKGSGSILYGPQTFGGIINYQTANPPKQPTLSLRLQGADRGYLSSLLRYGTTNGNTGIMAHYLIKRGNDFGLMDFSIHDVSTKFNLQLSPVSLLGIKLGAYVESSNATYVGLTQAMYASGAYDVTHLAPEDALHIRRYSASLHHVYQLRPSTALKTTLFAYPTTRDWSRQDFTTHPGATTVVRTVGNPNIPGGALYFLDRTGNRNRAFEVIGLEPRLSTEYSTGRLKHSLEAGFRLLYEQAHEQRIDGTTRQPTSGTLRDDEIRRGLAMSSWIQHQSFLTEQWSITPGLRFESFDYERDIMKLNNVLVDIRNKRTTQSWIPGLGMAFAHPKGYTLFTGVHRGFGPPRVKDAISNAGVAYELEAELSWNYEWGARWQDAKGINVELTLFYMNFENQIIPSSESSGQFGPSVTAGLVNGGKTRHRGVETSWTTRFDQLFDLGFGLSWKANTTYSKADFNHDRYLLQHGQVVNIRGNRLPYAPEWMIHHQLLWMPTDQLEVVLQHTYVGEQFGDPLNTRTPDLSGQVGLLPAWNTMDVGVNGSIKQLKGLRYSAQLKNVWNERYIASRRPQGIRVGLPRMLMVSMQYTL